MVLLANNRAIAQRWIDRNRDAVLKRDRYKCVRCGGTKLLEIDHIIPVCKGGENSMQNSQTLCRKCNRSKCGRLNWDKPKKKTGKTVLITIPGDIVEDLKILAVKANKDLKNYIQDELVKIVEASRKG